MLGNAKGRFYVQRSRNGRAISRWTQSIEVAVALCDEPWPAGAAGHEDQQITDTLLDRRIVRSSRRPEWTPGLGTWRDDARVTSTRQVADGGPGMTDQGHLGG